MNRSCVRWAGVLVTLAVLQTVAGCTKKPVSGNYCPVKKGAGDCMYLDLEAVKLTIKHPGGAVETRSAVGYLHGTIDFHPKAGTYAGKNLRLSFDLKKISEFDLEVENSKRPGGLPLTIRYARR